MNMETLNHFKLYQTKTELDQRIDSLERGQSIILSYFNEITCTVERSGNGKILRFVRTFADGSFEVFRKVDFDRW